MTPVVACLGVSGPTSPTHFGSGPRRILFIGNSLTGANAMPGMVAALAESAKVSPLPSVDVNWLPDFALIDHWTTGDGRRSIAAGYDVVAWPSHCRRTVFTFDTAQARVVQLGADEAVQQFGIKGSR